MRRRELQSRDKSAFIQPDSRGRLQLPKEFRSFPFFELERRADSLVLRPLRMVRAPLEARVPEDKDASAPWLNPEVSDFLKSSIIPKLERLLEGGVIPQARAAVLFGSRARGDALNSSDFDLAIFLPRMPGLFERDEWGDLLQNGLRSEFEELKRHGVTGELSIAWVPLGKYSPDADLPALYYALVEEGVVLWQAGGSWNRWRDSVVRMMRDKGVKSRGDGKSRVWVWNSKPG